MLRSIIHVSLEVPLSCDIISALLRRLIISLQQEVPYLLQIHLVEPIVNAVSRHTPVEVVRIRSRIIRIVPDKVRIVPSEIRIVVYVNSIIAVGLIERSKCGAWIPPIPIIKARVPVIIDIRVDPPNRGGNWVNSWRGRPSRTESEVLVMHIILVSW